jgi:plasmid stabilization system protein ParE
MRIRLLDSAKADLCAGAHFYESLAPGLGTYFLDCIEADIDILHDHAGIHPLFGHFHRLLAKRFPFAVYYRRDGSSVDIYAILDCRSDPESITQRLSAT